MSGIATIEENNACQPSREYPHEFRIRFRLWHSPHVTMTRSLPGPSGSGTCPVWLRTSADSVNKTRTAATDRIDSSRGAFMSDEVYIGNVRVRLLNPRPLDDRQTVKYQLPYGEWIRLV